jgi:hypothetical protein
VIAPELGFIGAVCAVVVIGALWGFFALCRHIARRMRRKTNLTDRRDSDD